MKKYIAILFLFVMIVFCVSVSFAANTTIIGTLNFLYPDGDTKGSGYFWDNREESLTLTNCTIDTENDYGLRLPDGATVILKGDNYISAKVAAITFSGDVIFKGTGSLTVEGGKYGFWNYSQNPADTLRITEGTFEISGGEEAICFYEASFIVAGGNLDIKSNSGIAANGKVFKFYGGNVSSNGTIDASYMIDCSDVNLNVLSKTSALVADKITIVDCKISIGNNENELSSSEIYNGESCLKLKAAGNHLGESAIFGKNCPKFVDYIVLVVAFLAPCAIIVAIILSKKKKSLVAANVSSEYIKEQDEKFKEKKKNRLENRR